MLKNILAAATLALALPVMAQPTVPEDKLVERYAGLAGSPKNAQSLISGLRDGKDITLTQGTTKVTIDPPTQKMGYGNVDNALALTEASLKQQGISDPSPQQLKSALLGVLDMRAEGKGWGQIAQSLGIKLGDVKRSERAPERMARAEKPERLEKPEKPQRPERPERPARPERPGKH